MSNQSQELEVLSKLLKFYKRKYKGSQLDEKFYDAVMDLVSTGDIKKSTYFAFCVDNDMEPHVNKKGGKSKSSGFSSSKSSDDDWFDDRGSHSSSGCGGGYSSSGCGGGYSRSSC